MLKVTIKKPERRHWQWTNFTPLSSVNTADYEQAFVGRDTHYVNEGYFVSTVEFGQLGFPPDSIVYMTCCSD